MQSHWFPIMLGIIGLIFLGFGLVALTHPKEEKGDITFEPAKSQAENVPQDRSQKTITIDIEGAVQKPGVYKLPHDASIQDALIAAGGMNNVADREKIARSLNLAAKIQDGGKIYIPFVGEQTVVVGGEGATVLGAETGSININTAVSKELDTLPGVGEVTAQKIISNRPYGAKEELLSKKIVNQKVFDQIKEKIIVY